MCDAMLFLSNACSVRAGRISALATNKYQKQLYINPSFPSYMQKRENIPLVFSFSNFETANHFVSLGLHLQPVVSAKSDPIAETLNITYAMTEHPTTLADICIHDLFDYDQEEISRFVLQTHSSFYLVDDVTTDRSELEARTSGVVLTPLNDVEINPSFQAEINHVLETIYRLK